MDTFDPGNEFRETFTPKVTNRLLNAIRRAYDTAFEYRAPADRGFSEQMFGFNLAGYCEHEITSEIQSGGRPFRLIPQGNTFRFQIGDFIAGCYRAGRTERENIWQAFPDNDNGIKTLANDDVWLPGMEPKVLPKLVLAHLGNSEDGLCALYLCAPKTFENGYVVEWAFAEEIWKRKGDELPLPDSISPAPTVPTEQVGRPVIRRKPNKEDSLADV